MNDLLLRIKEAFNGQEYDGYITICCPNPDHNDSRPSCFVGPEFYYCSACGYRGRTDRLLQRVENAPLREVKPVHSDNPFSRWTKTKPLPAVLRQAHLMYQASGSVYLEEQRKLDRVFLTKIGTGLLENWLTFPIRNVEHKIIGAVARAGDGNISLSKYIVPNGQPNMLYVPSWANVVHTRYVLVTFGILDAVTLAQLGFSAASTTGGKRLPSEVLDEWRRPIIFIPDRDEYDAAMSIAKNLGYRGYVWSFPYPDDCKDINDTLKMGVDIRTLVNDYLIGKGSTP